MFSVGPTPQSVCTAMPAPLVVPSTFCSHCTADLADDRRWACRNNKGPTIRAWKPDIPFNELIIDGVTNSACSSRTLHTPAAHSCSRIASRIRGGRSGRASTDERSSNRVRASSRTTVTASTFICSCRPNVRFQPWRLMITPAAAGCKSLLASSRTRRCRRLAVRNEER